MAAPDGIPGFTVERRLARTRFSVVYRCSAETFRRPVAVKVFRPAEPDANGLLAGYPVDAWRQRFLTERATLARFEHPNLIPVVAQGRTRDGAPWYAMPCLSARLRDEIGPDVHDAAAVARMAPPRRPRRLSLPRATAVLREVLGGLAALHAAGIVHRDVKPTNMLMARPGASRVRLGDLGMAKLDAGPVERDGVWIGTRDYIAPEQARNARDADARADVYSAAAVFHRMLAGRLAGNDATAQDGCADVPDAIAALLGDALSAEPDRRPRDAAAFLERLALASP